MNNITTYNIEQCLGPVKVHLLEKPEELESLAQAWDQMPMANDATPMQEHIWYLSCAETLVNQAKLAIIVIEDSSGLLAIAPMVKSTTFPGDYQQLGVNTLQEPSDLLYIDESALNILLQTLSQYRKPLLLERVCSNSPTVAAIRKVFTGKGIAITSSCSGLPYIKLNSSGDDPETLLSSRLRSDLRRARRKAEAIGGVSFEIHTPSSEHEFLPLFEKALQVEAAGWKGRLGSDLATDTLRQEFFRRYGIRAAEKGILRLAFMSIDSEPIAMQFAIQTGGSFWLLKIGYSEQFSKCSPGMLLMLETLRFAGQQGLSSYEFLGSSDQWTQRWTTLERPSTRINVYPFTMKSMIALSREIMHRAWIKITMKLKRQQ